MHGTILVYGNEPILVKTRALILEKAGYNVVTAETFENAMLVLMNHQIDVCVLCQSLTDEEQRGVSETARAVQPEIKCAVIAFEECAPPIEGVDLIRGLVGPSALLNAVGELLTPKSSYANHVSTLSPFRLAYRSFVRLTRIRLEDTVKALETAGIEGWNPPGP